MDVTAIDYHTAGEPFRIVTGGAPEPAGATVGERRERAAGLRGARRTSAGCSATSRAGTPTCTAASSCRPTTPAPTSASLFWHKDGYSTACGHGTIALGAWAVETGPRAGARATARST